MNRNKVKIKEKSISLYDKYITGRLNVYVKERCCDFKLLEEKCMKYKL
nr:type III toxin-antitoxin system ToxN/AbiQ family toxin [Bacilli bacterium]